MHSENPYQAPASPFSDPIDDHVLADRGTRLGAAIVDFLLVVGVMLPGLLGFAMFNDEESGFFAAVGLAGIGLLALGIYQIYLVSTTGQSLAKKWLGIRIVKLDGSPCGFVHGVVLRSWVISALGQIPLVGAIVAIVDPLMIFGEERRCLHDLIAGTKVVVAVD